MPEKIFSDADVNDFAKEVIKEIANKARLSPEIIIRELDDRIEFVLLTNEASAYLCFSPQKRVEAILREAEQEAIDKLKDVIEPELFKDAVRRYLLLSVYDAEIRNLIPNDPKEFKSSISRLEKDSRKFSAEAQRRKEETDQYLKGEVEAVEKLREFAMKVDELHPLWEYVIKYFEDNGYDAECLSIVSDEQVLALARGVEMPKDLIRRVFKRRDNVGNKRYRYEPLAFAVEHASRLINVPGEHDSLIKKYYDGKKFIGEGIIITLK